MRTILIVNQSTTVSVTDFGAAVKACQKQLDRDFAPLWGGLTATLQAGSADPKAPHKPTQETIYVLDDSDQMGALGYHEVAQGDIPVGFVFARTSEQDQSPWQTTLSHELLEQLVDPLIQTTAAVTFNGRSAVVGYEVCLAGETKVMCPDGEAKSIAELADDKKPFKVYAADRDGRIVAVWGQAARRTAVGRAVVRVAMCDGVVLRCTPDHRLLMADGNYREAGNLQAGDVLFSGEMSPGSPGADFPNGFGSDAVSSGEHPARCPAGSDGTDHTGRQFSSPALFASHSAVAGHSSFARSVDHVFAMRTDEEMIRSNAGRRVTHVAYAPSSRNCPVMQLVGNAMGEMGDATAANLPIAGATFSACPKPTAVGLLDSRSEPIQEGCGASIADGVSSAQISVPVHARPVRATQALCSDRSVANGHGAFGSHVKIVDFVEWDGKADVYDLAVPWYHNFAVEGGIFVHNCDPVEDDTYLIDGVPVSNFVTPAWFQDKPGAKGPFDYLGKLTAPLTMTAGGYVAYAYARLNWRQDVAHSKADRQPHYHRRQRQGA